MGLSMHASKGRGIPVAHVLNILERYFERPWVKQGCRYPLLSVSKCKKKKKKLNEGENDWHAKDT